ncbi:RcnB family protein [Sphingomonas mesophila]|uniref:RcnB family protein n=1 Tax=Sphingomonas mesophila TaxID=2303576 RepID=UPI001F07AF36|nr:RcnB family protein [Sphingomonas mesophila]
MRQWIAFALIAGLSAPAIAQDRDRSGGDRPMRAERAERAERSERSEAREQRREERREQREMRVQRVAAEPTAVAAPPSGAAEQGRGGHQWGGDGIARQQRWRRTDGALMPRQREVRSVPDTTTTGAVPGTITTQHRSRDGRRWSGDHRRWDRHGWRGDRRYDWRRWRDHNRSTFRIGVYIDPFGWGYNRWGIGSRLYPHYYRSSYWINDPWRYRLPEVYGPYRWVRYHNDALLIDTWSGEVVDVIYNFFW